MTKQAKISTSVAHVVYDRYGLPMALLEAPYFAKQMAELYIAKIVKNGSMIKGKQKTKTDTINLFYKHADPVSRFVVAIAHGHQLDLTKADIATAEQALSEVTAICQRNNGKFSAMELALTIEYYREVASRLKRYKKMQILYYSSVYANFYGFKVIDPSNGLMEYFK